MATPVIVRVALYARVSTLNGQNPEMQLAELRGYAQRRGWEVYSEYVDLGISGAKDSRPALNKMLADAHARKFDGIACWKLDRLGRSLKHLVTVIEDLEHYGVSFVSLRDNLDLSTPSGRLMMHIIGAMAQFERSLIQERVIAGIASAKSRGVKFGRPKVYVSALKIQQLRDAGIPWVDVAKRLNAGKGTCQRALARAKKEDAA
jgi:DNA invertase Pin-like site-specific DNA recombinase